MNFYENLRNSLLEAIDMEKEKVPLKERPGMPAKTLYVKCIEKENISGNYLTGEIVDREH